jgi:hypothetical protein
MSEGNSSCCIPERNNQARAGPGNVSFVGGPQILVRGPDFRELCESLLLQVFGQDALVDLAVRIIFCQDLHERAVRFDLRHP